MPDAVLDVIEDLAVAHLLHVGTAQIRRTRILAAADFGLPAAVISVAQLALLAVNLVSSGYVGAVGERAERILHLPEARGHRLVKSHCAMLASSAGASSRALEPSQTMNA